MNTHLALTTLALMTAAAQAQINAPSTVPGSPQGFNYPMTLEATVAAPKNHRVLFENDHVRLLEVTIWPNEREPMHGHARNSVFALDAVQPLLDNPPLDPSPEAKNRLGPSELLPRATTFPVCISMAPQAPHAAKVIESYPQHFYRMEFKRLDGDADFDTHWREWYPKAAMPAIGKVSSKMARRDIGSLPSEVTAPDNYSVLFKNNHMRLVEVIIRPGETTPLHGSPYYTVLAFDVPEPGKPGGPTFTVQYADQTNPLITMEVMQKRGSPEGWNFPTCMTIGPQAARQITNTGTVPIHHYRFEFLRVDGRDFATRWKQWYPEMVKRPL